MELSSKKCLPCEKGTPPLGEADAKEYLKNLSGWTLSENRIEKEYRFPAYLQGLEFSYKLGKLAEQEGHHPDILVKWRRVKVTLTTHAIKGLSENDFIMAAKSDIEYEKISRV